MIALQILILLAVFLILILADLKYPLLSAGILMFLFMWGALVFKLSAIQLLYYPIGIVFYLAVRANFKAEGREFSTNNNQADLNGSRPGGIISGVQYHLFSIFLG